VVAEVGSQALAGWLEGEVDWLEGDWALGEF
jgi:hypothetical protein